MELMSGKGPEIAVISLPPQLMIEILDFFLIPSIKRRFADAEHPRFQSD